MKFYFNFFKLPLILIFSFICISTSDFNFIANCDGFIVTSKEALANTNIIANSTEDFSEFQKGFSNDPYLSAILFMDLHLIVMALYHHLLPIPVINAIPYIIVPLIIPVSTYFSKTKSDAAEAWQLGLQDPATPIVEGMIFFHNYLMFFIIVIGLFVLWMLYRIVVLFNKKTNPVSENFTHSSILEVVWTIIPAVILLFIAVPSFALLYSLDELIDPVITLKIIGHQWYWSYEYSDYATLEGGESLNFDSYMLATDDLTVGAFRLLEVDNRVILPVKTHIRLLITAADVLHSWAMPSFGLKIDACPGRLSQASLFIKRPGVYYGQCSEICGVNHGFMPIVVRGVSVNTFVKWVTSKLDNLVLDS